MPGQAPDEGAVEAVQEGRGPAERTTPASAVRLPAADAKRGNSRNNRSIYSYLLASKEQFLPKLSRLGDAESPGPGPHRGVPKGGRAHSSHGRQPVALRSLRAQPSAGPWVRTRGRSRGQGASSYVQRRRPVNSIRAGSDRAGDHPGRGPGCRGRNRPGHGAAFPAVGVRSGTFRMPVRRGLETTQQPPCRSPALISARGYRSGRLPVRPGRLQGHARRRR